MEVKRQLDVLDRTADRRFLCGDDYNIADIATYAWYGNVVLHDQYEATEFLDVKSYTNVVRWRPRSTSAPPCSAAAASTRSAARKSCTGRTPRRQRPGLR